MLMKIFISWSGDRSKQVAEALGDWLRHVIQPVKPWISARDVEKGARWRIVLAKQLEESRVGISCVTRDNQHNPWLLYEAGSLAKSVEESYLWTYLLDLSPSDVTGPLAEFQHTRANEEETKELVKTINRALGENRLPEDVVDTAFEKYWPDLQKKLRAIPQAPVSAPPVREPRDMIEEILDLVRGLARDRVDEQQRARFMDMAEALVRSGTTPDDLLSPLGPSSGVVNALLLRSPGGAGIGARSSSSGSFSSGASSSRSSTSGTPDEE